MSARDKMPEGEAREVIGAFEGLRRAQTGGRYAPHKPLLLLLVLARCARGEGREVAYRDIDQPLFDLLREFGPSRRSTHPEYPFWHLQSDGIWVVRDAELLERRVSNTNVGQGELRQVNPGAGTQTDACSDCDLFLLG